MWPTNPLLTTYGGPIGGRKRLQNGQVLGPEWPAQTTHEHNLFTQRTIVLTFYQENEE